jgi:hypothetical protein
MSKESFLVKALAKYGSTYNYDSVVYVNSQTKVTIFYPRHGAFTQRPSMHLFGQGCPRCSKEATEARLALSRAIKKTNYIHGGKYSYSLIPSILASFKERVEIVCPTHGVFRKEWKSHLHGGGCPECENEPLRIITLMKGEDYFARAREVHGDKYDYSLSVYTGVTKKLKIICKACGLEFTRTAGNHLYKKHGCPEQGKIASIAAHTKTTRQFISEAMLVHQGYYDYAKTEYMGAQYPVIITCPHHGDFRQEANSHLQGQGCRACDVNRQTEASRHAT